MPPPVPPKPIPKFIKIRILTWNMHDSLPKVCPCSMYSYHRTAIDPSPRQGDVEELLGSIPTSNPSVPPPSDEPPTLPVFPATPEHPYHIVIV